MAAKVGTCFPDFPEEEPQAPLTLTFTTDTQVPQTLVLVYHIHSLDRPFCCNPCCFCQQQRPHITTLLARIARAEITMYQASRFQDATEGKES